ncbi:hypothetical protein OHA37_06485 [Streptomyces sp. NBC_00335]|uniref:hypothetical protein n=1 Tax=unclassified Streptomyces TaxID=2593676 RepID=UPI0022542F7F|nr:MULTISPECIES: hypothetical protein [unclassified Streptomyces]MCX5403528.1 hypothetical protein [Streptomyces sp. NBC_00086]
MIITPNTEELLLAAAYNNAAWCAAVCRDGGFTAQAWSSPRPTPLYYPDAVTLTRDTDTAALLAGIDTAAPRASVKDSFAVLDLAPAGFEVLFGAEWIHRPAGAPGAVPALEWSRISGPGELVAWETAWDGEESTGLFHPGLLTGTTGETAEAAETGDTGEIAFLAGRDAEGRILAGAAANRTGEVVGVSNVFSADGTPDDEAWTGALTLAASLWPGLALVGYESGDDLDTALRHGFTAIGPLRVWVHSG